VCVCVCVLILDGARAVFVLAHRSAVQLQDIQAFSIELHLLVNISDFVHFPASEPRSTCPWRFHAP
jgi:hypothetical protein